MQAILVKEHGGPEKLVLEQHALPPLEKDKVLIEVKYAGVNFPDTLIIRGLYQFQPDLPFTPGGEVAGIIKEVGAEVTTLKPGDRVVSGTSWGGFAEEAIGFAANTYEIPESLSFEKAAASLMTYGTVIHALKDRALLRKGEKLVVLGAAGGVGSACIELGKLMGAEVIACASTDEKLEVCKKLGADRLVNYTTQDLKGTLKELGGRMGVNVIFDPVGGRYSEPAFRAIGPGGRHLVIGFAAGEVPAIPWNLPLLKSAAIVGVFWGGFFRYFPDQNRANIEQLLKWLADGSINPLIDKIFPLTETATALKRVEERKVKGKVLLSI